MAILYLTRVAMEDGAIRYFQAKQGDVLELGGTIIPVAKAWTEISKAAYDAATLTCAGTGEIATPVTPTPAPVFGFSLLGYAWDGGDTNYNFKGYVLADDGVAVEIYLEPLQGQTPVLSSFVFQACTNTSETVAGQGFNRITKFDPKFAGGTGVAPGTWRLWAQRQGNTDPALRKSMVLNLIGGRGSESGISSGYTFKGTTRVEEGSSTLLYLTKYENGAEVSPGTVVFEIQNGRAGLQSSTNGNGLTINCFANSVQGDSYTATVVARVGGVVVASTPLSVVDKTTTVITPPPANTDSVDTIAYAIIENDPGNANSTVNVWLYWKVTGNPVLWVGMYGNNGTVLYEGTQYLSDAYGDGYTRALRTTNQTRGNALRYVARLGSSTGQLVLDKVFDTAFSATGKQVVYPATPTSNDGNVTETFTYNNVS